MHFMQYDEDALFIGRRSPKQRGVPDITVEFSDWSMPVRMQRFIARELTPVVMRLFSVAPAAKDSVNIRFHSYPSTDFAVGGRLLSDLVLRIARVLKHWLAR